MNIMSKTFGLGIFHYKENKTSETIKRMLTFHFQPHKISFFPNIHQTITLTHNKPYAIIFSL